MTSQVKEVNSPFTELSFQILFNREFFQEEQLVNNPKNSYEEIDPDRTTTDNQQVSRKASKSGSNPISRNFNENSSRSSTTTYESRQPHCPNLRPIEPSVNQNPQYPQRQGLQNIETRNKTNTNVRSSNAQKSIFPLPGWILLTLLVKLADKIRLTPEILVIIYFFHCHHFILFFF